jgi:nicotinate-nucleotide pyrophosphorylase (carboxylating)
MDSIDLTLLRDTLLAALREDVGTGDITSRSTIPSAARARARFTAKQSLIVAGIPVVQEIVKLVDPAVEFESLASDGASVPIGAPLAEMSGSARSILTAERTSLNLLQRMCGIALTRAYVDHQGAGPHCRYAQDRFGLRCRQICRFPWRWHEPSHGPV